MIPNENQTFRQDDPVTEDEWDDSELLFEAE